MNSLKQLNSQDAAFLHLDTDRASTGGTMIYIYEQPDRGDEESLFPGILAHIESRLESAPMFKQKLNRVPLDLDNPYWVTEENFNLEHHVHHVALPKPGDWNQFCLMAARLTTPHFDFNRPLWEMYVIEGLDNIDWLPSGSFAVLTRMHHAAVDGTVAAEITWGLHDLVPQPTDRQFASQPEARKPSMIEVATRAASNNFLSPFRLLKPVTRILPTLGTGLLSVAGHAFERNHKGRVPRTRFNGSVSPYRAFDSCILDLNDVKSLRRAVEGSTVNDVVVTIIGGGLRRFLTRYHELPSDSLVAGMPVNTRGRIGSESSSANQMSVMTAIIGTNIEDPIERLLAVYDATRSSKSMLDGVAAKELTDISKHAPASLLLAAGRLVSIIGFDGGKAGGPFLNLAISNVPGPAQPLYMMGSKLKYWSIVGPVMDGMGMLVGVTSYDGRLFISPTACREMVPDPAFLVRCIDESFAELQSAVTQRETARPKSKKAKKKSTATRRSAK